MQPADSLSKAAAMIPVGSTVLDIGAGPGVLGAYLTQQRSCVVDGVEGNPEAAELARASYRRVLVADLETADLVALCEGQRYDVAVCADVLEHLRDPGFVLAQVAALLTATGTLIVSVPNIGYVGVVAGLLRGEFNYSDDGVLDRTHVRFFTRRSLFELLSAHGLTVVLEDETRVHRYASEFEPVLFDRLAPSLLTELLRAPDASTYQFVVSASPSSSTLARRQAADRRARFPGRLYWRKADEAFGESACVEATGLLEAEPYTLGFPLPDEELAGLRFDPMERKGLVRLYDIVVYDADGYERWRMGRTTTLAHWPTQQLAITTQCADGSIELRATGDDPVLVLPLDAVALAHVRKGRVEVRCTWPATAAAPMGSLRSLLQKLTRS